MIIFKIALAGFCKVGERGWRQRSGISSASWNERENAPRPPPGWCIGFARLTHAYSVCMFPVCTWGWIIYTRNCEEFARNTRQRELEMRSWFAYQRHAFSRAPCYFVSITGGMHRWIIRLYSWWWSKIFWLMLWRAHILRIRFEFLQILHVNFFFRLWLSSISKFVTIHTPTHIIFFKIFSLIEKKFKKLDIKPIIVDCFFFQSKTIWCPNQLREILLNKIYN